jgi:hypothetical protein
MFKGRKLLIASMHCKERAFAPLLEPKLGVTCVTAKNFDTDVFGTFSGEVPRRDIPMEILRKKCRNAIEQSDLDLVIASEGSFGPHPTLMMIPANEEWVMLFDRKNDLEISARVLSTSTNFDGRYINDLEALHHFAAAVHFPTHALILRNSKGGNEEIIKGITGLAVLISHFESMKAKYGKVFAETDMRAMHNPTRMKVIAAATEQLIQKINHACPACTTPGFDVVKVETGLLCAHCGMPTKAIKKIMYECKKCTYQSVVMFPNKKETEDPMYCDYCNP